MSLHDDIVAYWDRQPCNLLHSDLPIGTREYFEANTARRYHVEPHLMSFADFPRWRGARVLEIGCGIGADAEQFVRHGAEYVGVDISGASVDLARKRFACMDLNGDFQVRDASKGLADLGQFDLIWSCGVIHHWPDDRRLIAAAREVARPDAQLRIMLYATNSWKRAMIDAGLDQYEAQSECPYARTYTQDQVRDLLEPHWTMLEIQQDHCFMYNVSQYRQGRYVLEPWFAAMPQAMRDAMRKEFGWHLLVTAGVSNPD